MILAGSNTYTGATTVTGGILEITGAIAGAKSLSVSSGAVLYLAGGTLQIAGAITNNGLMKLSGSASVTLTGAFTNNGILDLINGPQTLPAGFINNGTVLTAGSLQVQQLAMSGSSFALTIQGYPQHTYQLQFTPSLAAPITWTGVGASQTGAGAPLIFTDTGASSMQGYYQILVSP
jgi:autotransporter-associated beta strand protein